MRNQLRLSAVAGYLDVRPAADTDLTALCELATIACDVPYAAINLIDDELQHSVAAAGIDPGVCVLEESMCASVVATGTAAYVEDARHDPRYAGHPWVDGRLGTIRLYAAAPLRTPAGYVVGTICVFDDAEPWPNERRRNLASRRQEALARLAVQVVDVLELELRTARLADAVAELARSQEQLSAFAGQVSHDLKTPLTASLGFAELLAEHPIVASDSTASRYVERVVASGQRMLDTIEDLLGYARLGGTLHKERVTLAAVMSAVVEDLGELTHGADVSWSGVDVLADRNQLRSLLQNLVGNALTYRRPDVTPRVSVETIDTPLGFELMVADNGTGIPADQRENILAPLARLRTDVPGTGLGLATCARIAAAHGGKIYFGDTPGGGTTVTVLLPH